jgi:hypothetical protein
LVTKSKEPKTDYEHEHEHENEHENENENENENMIAFINSSIKPRVARQHRPGAAPREREASIV